MTKIKGIPSLSKFATAVSLQDFLFFWSLLAIFVHVKWVWNQTGKETIELEEF